MKSLKITGLLTILSVFSNVMFGQVKHEWAEITGGMGEALAIDNQGNVYMTGGFGGTQDFDPSQNIFNLTGLGSDDIFIQKMDAEGHLIWAKSMGGTQQDISTSMAIDNSGNIYITGHFRSIADFDPDTGTLVKTPFGGKDIFVEKFDSNGNMIWMKQIGGGGNDIGYDIAVDTFNNVYLTGYFEGNVDFDPDTSVFLLTSVYRDVFVVKLDPNGTFVWAKKMGGADEDIGRSITVDPNGNSYITGTFKGIADFDPGPQILNFTSAGNRDFFILRLDSNGNLVWGYPFGAGYEDYGYKIELDKLGYVYTVGNFYNTVDFNPGTGVNTLVSPVIGDMFILKLDTTGAFVWVKDIRGTSIADPNSLFVDENGNVFTTGRFDGTIDFAPDASVYYLTAQEAHDIFIHKLDANGDFSWVHHITGGAIAKGHTICLDGQGSIYVAGDFTGARDFDPGVGVDSLIATTWPDNFFLKLRQKGVLGRVFNDFNTNCIFENNETGVGNRLVLIQPQNIITQTNSAGIWVIDSLPVGNYSVIIDTTHNWINTCYGTNSFQVLNLDSVTYASTLGIINTNSCQSPYISIHAPFLRLGSSDQQIYVHACNLYYATGILDSAFVLVELDSLMTVQSVSLPYTSLGNNVYRISIADLYPGECVDFVLSCSVSINASMNQTLCMSAELYPVHHCMLDSVPNPYPNGVSPCIIPWDHSSLSVEGQCLDDTVRFVIHNNGAPVTGDMTCFTPIRLYIDGQFIIMDSIQLAGGDSIVFDMLGDGRTWRLEVDQHPLHPGNSNPNATLERCGNLANWTPNLVNILPQDDADPIIDIYCGVVMAPFDPNDKTGYPYGIDSAHYIQQNQDIEYVVRFQNTGNDTAFTVVIRDTLLLELDIFSVRSGTSSHDYNFRMYGPRVLEWTFNNIMLPDSNTNEPASHGFVKFKVKQNPNLPIGTIINNSVSIYFDFNAPIITNTYFHTVDSLNLPNWDGQQTIGLGFCDSIQIGNYIYNNAGTYWQTTHTNGLDSLYTIELVSLATDSIITASQCDSIVINGQSYNSSGTYNQFFQNVAGCDSTITLNLTITNSTIATLNETACDSFNLNSQTYNSSGTYTQMLTNATGCDSTLTLNLSIENSSAETLSDSACLNYTLNGQNYNISGTYTQLLINGIGCDSILTLNLNILMDSTVVQNGNTLSANQPNATYQWLDCAASTPIPGETGQSFIPTANGSYAVQITNGTCTATSACYNVTTVGVEQVQGINNIRIYPNPTKNHITIDFGAVVDANIQVLTIAGATVGVRDGMHSVSSTGTDKADIDLSDYPAGLYMVVITVQGQAPQAFKVSKM